MSPIAVRGSELEIVSLTKVGYYHQSSSGAPTLVEYSVLTGADFSAPVGGVTVSLQKPNGTVILVQDDPFTFALDQSYPTAAAMNNAYPDGNYRFVLSGTVSGSYQISVSPASLPAAPRVLNFDSLQSLTANVPFVLSWQAIPGATVDDLILVLIQSGDEAFDFSSEPLTGTATSVTIPGLPSDRLFFGVVVFYHLVEGSTLPNNVIGLYSTGAATGFPLSTFPARRAPVILTQPSDYTAAPNQKAVFSVVADGQPIPTYQWQRRIANETAWLNLAETNNYNGTNQATLTINQAEPAFSGDAFRCVVTNNMGQVISDAATLAVQPGYFFRRYAGVSQQPGYLDGSGSLARFHAPAGVALDGSGRLFVADRVNHRVRLVPTMGVIAPVAGSGMPGSADGNGSSAQFNAPIDVCIDAVGNLFVADRGNHTIRKITPAGDVTTFAGLAGQKGSADGTGAAARFASPAGVAVDALGNVFVADEENHTIRKITSVGEVSTLAGLAGQPGSSDGAAPAARFNAPMDVAVDRRGNLFIADAGNGTIRKVAAGGLVSTVAGQAGSHGSVDGNGASARFERPCSLAVDAAGYVYVVDTGSHVIRRITPSGGVATIGGLSYTEGSDGGIGSGARFAHPRGVAVSNASVIYVADQWNHSIKEGAPWTSVSVNQQMVGTLLAGSSLQLVAEVSSSSGAAPGFQWRVNGADIVGATSATFTLPSLQRFHSGAYTVVVVVDGIGSVSNPINVNVQVPVSSNARLLNLSTRALALSGENVLIPGFVVHGSGSKRLLVRAVGQKLAAFGLNPNHVLPDPRMVLKRWNGNAYEDVAANNNWGQNANVADIIATTASLYAFALDAGSGDAALLVDLPVGQYTVVADDESGGHGVAIVELYDADAASGSGSTSTAQLVNISNRGFVGTGTDLMIPGLVISHEGPKTLLVRAVGPRLADFGVGGVLDDPEMTIYRRENNGSSTPILTNDNWEDNPDAVRTATVAVQVHAFALNAGGKDAALVVTLLPGIYTVHASGKNDCAGVALVEVYDVQ